MATDKPRFTITLEDELFEQLEEYRHKNKISTRSKAAAQLVKRGLSFMEATVKEVRLPGEISEAELEFIDIFNQLNLEGKKRIMEEIEILIESGRFSKNIEDKLA